MQRASFLLVPLTLCAALLPPAHAQEDGAEKTPTGVAVTMLSGARERGRRLVGLDSEQVVLQRGETEKTLPLADVLVIEFATASDPVRQPGPDEAALDLWSGEVLRGRVTGGSDASIAFDSPLLGDLQVSLDALAGVRFLARLEREAEPPDLASDPANDIVHMSRGDRIVGSVERFGPEGLYASSGDQEPTLVPYSRVTAVRLAAYDPEAPEGTSLDVVLRDGTRLTGVEPRVEGEHLRVRSYSGFEARVRLADVVAAHVRSDAFTYVSDLEPAEVAVKPFWKMAAGDPVVLYAPRVDRAFSGRPLTCGGHTWTKGVGVFGGTSLTYALDGRYREFRAAVGLDDGAGDLGGVVFEVLVDGKVRWTSGFVRAASRSGRGSAGPIEVQRIALEGAKRLTLRVTTGDREDPYPIQDEANWLGALLVK